MRHLLALALWLATQAWIFAWPATNAVDAAAVAAAAEQFFTVTRSAVGVAIEAGTKAGTNVVADLSAILAVVDGESNKLHQAGFEAKLDLAARQVEAVRTQVVTLLQDPANKAMAAKLEPQQWLDRIARQKEVGKILEIDLARLRVTLEELRRWANVLVPVAPPDQLAAALRTRLTELALDWKRSGDTRPNQDPKVEAPKRVRPPRADTEPANTVVQGSPSGSHAYPPALPVQPTKSSSPTSTQVSPAVADVLTLAEVGLTDANIGAFIDRYPSRFGLDGDQVIYLNGKLSSALIYRMLEHDSALRGKALR